MEKACFSNIRSNIISLLETAQDEVLIAVCWFTSEEIFEVLCKLVKQGVKVDLVVLNDFINNREDGLDFQIFINLGGNFYFGDDQNPMHNKYCIVDKNHLINGSYNWTYYAENRNEENIIIHTKKPKLIKAFQEDFTRIVSGLNKVDKIKVKTNVEMPDVNLMGVKSYLSKDYLWKGVELNSPRIVAKALNLDKDNFEIQQKSVQYKINKRRQTVVRIVEETKNDTVVVLVPENTEIPTTGSHGFMTSADNQKGAKITIRCGTASSASGNSVIGSFVIRGIPPKPAGEVSLRTKWSIDVYGILRVTEIIEETNNRVVMTYDVSHLLSEVKT
jgi:hypothetical protein